MPQLTFSVQLSEALCVLGRRKRKMMFLRSLCQNIIDAVNELTAAGRDLRSDTIRLQLLTLINQPFRDEFPKTEFEYHYVVTAPGTGTTNVCLIIDVLPEHPVLSTAAGRFLYMVYSNKTSYFN